MEFGANPSMDLIKDSNEANFMSDVVEASQEVPVIVDFWAPWCGPCKALGPALEAAVSKRGGKVKMVKINVDENQGIAGQLRIQSIPTVYAFFQGQPVDAFQGNLGPAEIDRFLDQLASHAPNSPIDDALEQAEALLDAGEIEAAGQYYSAVLAQEPENPQAGLGLANVVIEMGELDKAKEIIAALPEGAKAQGEALLNKINMLEAAQNSGPIDDLLAKISANPDDHQTRIDLATAFYASGRADEAIDQLIESFRRDREWNDGAAKAKLLEMFSTMDAKDPALAKGRRKFTSLVFM